MTLKDLTDKTLFRIKTTQVGNIFSDGKVTCLLKPTNRQFDGVSKKPVYYLSAIANGRAEYLSGMFETANNHVFSADYKDGLGIKHIVMIEFAEQGSKLTVRAS